MVILMSVPGMSACTIWTMSLSRTKNGTLRDFANLSILVWKMVREIYSFLNIYIYIYIVQSRRANGRPGRRKEKDGDAAASKDHLNR